MLALTANSQTNTSLDVGTLTVETLIVSGPNPSMDQFFNSTGDKYIALTIPPSITTYKLFLPATPASGYMYGTYDGSNSVNLYWTNPPSINNNSNIVTNTTITYLGIPIQPYALYDARTNVYRDSGITLASNNDIVKQWNDISGNNRHLLSNSTSNFFQLQTNQQNGNSAIIGKNTYLRTSQLFGNLSSVHIFLVFYLVDPSGYGQIIGGPNYGWGVDWFSIFASGGGDIWAGTDNDSKRVSMGYSLIPIIIEAKLNNGLVSIRKNGGTWINAPLNGSKNTSLTPLQISTIGNLSTIQYFEIVIYDKVLNDVDSSIVESNLNSTWSIH